MSRKHQEKNSRLASFNDSEGNTSFKSAGLVKIKPNSLEEDESSISLGRFLLNPSTWEENKTTNWSMQNIPGQSDPILQWTSGGARSVNFECLVTRDTNSKQSRDPLDSAIEGAVNAVGSIASNFFGVNVPNIASLFSPKQQEGEFLTITDKLNYYRSLLYPIYDQNSTLLNSPPLVKLYVGKTFGNNEYWVVTNLRIKITKQLPNLTPMEALVGFQLVEYTVNPRSGGEFTGEAPPAGQNSATNFFKSLF